MVATTPRGSSSSAWGFSEWGGMAGLTGSTRHHGSSRRRCGSVRPRSNTTSPTPGFVIASELRSATAPRKKRASQIV